VNSIASLKRVACEIKLLNTASAVPQTLLPIHEVFQTNSHFYYIMDRFGRDVFDFMKLGEHSKRGVGYENAVIIFTSVCEGLASLHRLGYAHRDMKSENVLVEHDLRPDGTYIVTGVKVIDLGLACDMEDETTRYESCGSRGFMAPESIMRRVQNPAVSDSWSLACLGLEIILGRQWFTEVWFPFFKEIDHTNDDETLKGLDFGPLEANVQLGLEGCNRRRTERNLMKALERMLVINPNRRIGILQCHRYLRAAYDGDGKEFDGVGVDPVTRDIILGGDGGGGSDGTDGSRNSPGDTASSGRSLDVNAAEEESDEPQQWAKASPTGLPDIHRKIESELPPPGSPLLKLSPTMPAPSSPLTPSTPNNPTFRPPTTPSSRSGEARRPGRRMAQGSDDSDTTSIPNSSGEQPLASRRPRGESDESIFARYEGMADGTAGDEVGGAETDDEESPRSIYIRPLRGVRTHTPGKEYSSEETDGEAGAQVAQERRRRNLAVAS